MAVSPRSNLDATGFSCRCGPIRNRVFVEHSCCVSMYRLHSAFLHDVLLVASVWRHEAIPQSDPLQVFLARGSTCTHAETLSTNLANVPKCGPYMF